MFNLKKFYLKKLGKAKERKEIKEQEKLNASVRNIVKSCGCDRCCSYKRYN